MNAPMRAREIWRLLLPDHISSQFASISPSNIRHWLGPLCTRIILAPGCKNSAPKMRKPEDSKQMKELREAFNMFDSDGSGSIDLGELRNVLRAMGQFPTPVELAQLMERMDKDGNGTVDFEEFSEAMVGQAEDDQTERQLQELQDVFSLLDTDGSGQLSADELQRALKILGVAMSRPEVELLIKEIDSNGDGEVSCDELLQYVLSFDGGDDERGH